MLNEAEKRARMKELLADNSAYKERLENLRKEQRKDLPAKTGHVADAIENIQGLQQSRKRPFGAPGGAAPPAAKRLAKSTSVVTEKSAKAAQHPKLPQVVLFSAKVAVVMPPPPAARVLPKTPPPPAPPSQSAPGGEAPAAAAAAAGPVYSDATRFGIPPHYYPQKQGPPKAPPPALDREYKIDPQRDADIGPQPDAATLDKNVRFKEQPEIHEVEAAPAKRAKHEPSSPPPPTKPPILLFIAGAHDRHIHHGTVLFLHCERDPDGQTMCIVRMGERPNFEDL